MRALATATVLYLVLGSGTALAQSKTGTSVGQFLGIEPSARIAGMGNAGVALYDGLESVYYNPAAMGRLDRPTLLFTYSDWYAGIAYNYAAAALPVRGLGTLFASVTSLDSGEIEVRTVERPLGTGARYSVSDLSLGLGYGRQINERFAAGVQVNYVHEAIWNSSQNTMTVNFGTVYQLSETGFKIGSSLSNVGVRSRFTGRDLAFQVDKDPDRRGDNSTLPAEDFTGDFPMPLLFRVGVSIPKDLGESSQVIILLDAFNPSDNAEGLSAGAEWSWKETLSLRAGYQSLFQEDSELGVTLGVGLRGGVGDGRFSFDYAWADHDRLEETHRMSVAFAF